MSPCSKNLDSQEDYCAKIGTFWNINYIGSRHAAIPIWLPILNRSEQFEENVHFRSFLVIPLVILFDIRWLLGLAYGCINLRK